jgi:hypothetical protein
MRIEGGGGWQWHWKGGGKCVEHLLDLSLYSVPICIWVLMLNMDLELKSSIEGLLVVQ